MSPHRAAIFTGDNSAELVEFDTPPTDPMELVKAWFDNAVEHAVREPFSAVLSTSSKDGRVSSRVLLVKDLDDEGLVFTTWRTSNKGRDLSENPYASLNFYWRETIQQLTLSGPVQELSPDASDVLFHARPKAAQATTAVAKQSQPLQDEQTLHQEAKALLDSPDEVARPSDWTAYRLVPQTIEFWYGRADRLHRRLRYDRPEISGAWDVQRLQP